MMVAGRTSRVRTWLTGATVLCGLWIAAAATFVHATGPSCPVGAVAIAPGASIQAAVDRDGAGAVFCLQAGVHREQDVQPRSNQTFYGENGTILNGSRILTGFRH